MKRSENHNQPQAELRHRPIHEFEAAWLCPSDTGAWSHRTMVWYRFTFVYQRSSRAAEKDFRISTSLDIIHHLLSRQTRTWQERSVHSKTTTARMRATILQTASAPHARSKLPTRSPARAPETLPSPKQSTSNSKAFDTSTTHSTSLSVSVPTSSPSSEAATTSKKRNSISLSANISATSAKYPTPNFSWTIQPTLPSVLHTTTGSPRTKSKPASNNQ